MSVPTILYKYVRIEHALSVLQEQKLKITPPNEFDDPFEFLLRVEGKMRRSQIKKMMKSKEHEKKVYQTAKYQGIVVGSFKEFKRTFRTDREKLVSDAIQGTGRIVSEYLKQPYQAEISKKFGVLCLTEVPDSTLMWSHYASGHRGIVLGLEIPSHWKMHEVTYSKERVAANLGWEVKDRSIEEMLVKLVKSKGDDWAYEKEWRAISELKDARKQVLQGKIHYFVPVGTEIVKEIILGLRLPNQYLGAIQALQRHKYPQARLLQATLHENRFTILLNEVSAHS